MDCLDLNYHEILSQDTSLLLQMYLDSYHTELFNCLLFTWKKKKKAFAFTCSVWHDATRHDMIYDLFVLESQILKTYLRDRAIAKSPVSAHSRGGTFLM